MSIRPTKLPIALLFLAIISVAGVTSARGQSTEGSLVGAVTDATGARIPNPSVTVHAIGFKLERKTAGNSLGEFRVDSLPPGKYLLKIDAAGFAQSSTEVKVSVDASPTIAVVLNAGPVRESVQVQAPPTTLVNQPIETTSSVQKTTIGAQDLEDLPLAARSFANIAYLAPNTEPVEPSDPTKARITAVSFHGSSGLNVDLSVDGGDNNDDWIGGFLQNFSPDAIEEFTVRTAQYDADTGRTVGGSVIISTRRGTDLWHGGGAFYYRGEDLNARNKLDNPEPNPKQPFSRDNAVFSLGGPIVKEKFWFFTSLEYVHENASESYSVASLDQFHALAQLASMGLVPRVTSINVPTSVPIPFRDTLFTARLDWAQSNRSSWFLRGGIDRNHTQNNLIQQGALPSTGALTVTNYASLLLSNTYQFSPAWVGNLVLEGAGFRLTESRNSDLGEAFAFPFTSTVLTTSGLETFGDNQFITGITAFPVLRMQQKYQVRYDVIHSTGRHTPKFGVNFVNEPVLGGALAANAENLFQLPENPAFYLSNPAQFVADLNQGNTFTPASDGGFAQSVRRLGLYAQDSWRVLPSLTLNYGLRYDTTFGLFKAEGRDQDQNPAVITLDDLGIPLAGGIPHDYRRAIAPRFGIAYSPGTSNKTVIRAGAGLYYSDLAQNGWAQAFQAVNTPLGSSP
ncbi:MAG TPA: carboxypeptidase regulatory-like domain-containing protein, partial [Blastocatellia bacterium]|nr:carboxypeptidase regulatory-like domain-containing protein [Blastocatellia bacterium]